MQALTEVVRAGKVRYIGFSEWSPDQIRASIALENVEHFVSSQPQYSMLWRRPEEQVIPLCRKNGISQIVWSPLAQGVLTGKYSPDAPPPQHSRVSSSQMGGFMSDLMRPPVLRAVQGLQPLAREAGCSLTQFALAWVLREPNIASAIVGASRPEQLDETVAASGKTIDPALFIRAEQILAGV
jgi:aryl-alcohol dehydrogenase-like predicted oxidoreductase